MEERIRIAGLGISGLYLYWRLKNDGFDVTGFDIKKEKFYIPCGYATNENIMQKYMSLINIDFEKYVFSRANQITFAGNKFDDRILDPSGLCTFDKNKLEEDGRNSIEISKINRNKGGLIIDATGISRSYLGKSPGDSQYFTLEYLTDSSDHRDFYFYFFEGGRGYFWSFPLGNRYHIGAGSLSKADLDTVRKYIPVRITSRNIRMSPQFSYIQNGNVIGVGEAIGTVSPITGEGIVPSLRSAEILYECIKKYGIEDAGNAYRHRIMDEFGYYYRLSRLVSNIQAGRILNLSNIAAIKYVKKTVNEFGIRLEILSFIRHFI
ncbi:MAG: NAD(P)/FAD-dependent oxidoreductase [Ferroplasma sp.]|uniref:NAD(P)/FAD-dependent oxidoreductase n=1 Tax=Ferroplasma sp. TaxID=2591003 RepID=UPI002815D6B4|nr:NAD(P)/FAD-dependent oxidoreductase [Ferroplasma sp.]WMT52234.1 MAG: NAD(P)/FAD-dependent oxidoreductase [Ferroplasma sp.]